MLVQSIELQVAAAADTPKALPDEDTLHRWARAALGRSKFGEMLVSLVVTALLGAGARRRRGFPHQRPRPYRSRLAAQHARPPLPGREIRLCARQTVEGLLRLPQQ